MKLPSKDELMKQLRQQISDEQDIQDHTPYTCSKCDMPVKFTFIMKPIRESGLCPSCYHGG